MSYRIAFKLKTDVLTDEWKEILPVTSRPVYSRLTIMNNYVGTIVFLVIGFMNVNDVASCCAVVIKLCDI